VKILVIVPTFPKTSETFVLNQLVGVLQRGHELQIISLHRPEPEPVQPAVKAKGLLERTSYLDVPRSRVRRVRLGLALIWARMRRGRFDFLPALNPLRFGKRAISLEVLCSLRPFIEKPRFDVIHCQFGPSGIFAQQVRDLGFLRDPIITTFHGYDVSAYIKEYGVGVYKSLFAKGDAFTCSSEFIRSRLKDIGCPAQKLLVFKLGTDLRRIPFRKRTRSRGEPVRCLTIARLVEVKGIEYVIRAVALARKIYPYIQYNVIGDGELRQGLSHVVVELGLEEVVGFEGWQTEGEITLYFEEAHIFILASVWSSRGEAEGQGLVLQEAQAAGLPVIATRHGALPEGMLEGRSGYLVPERDPQALAQMIAKLAQESEIWPRLGWAGRDLVEREYDLEIRNDALIRLYETVAAARKPLPAAL
jgi:colanic acid/amylovoran biosynthesis glycosyltransferase